MINSGVVTLEELSNASLISPANLVVSNFSLANMLNAGITNVAELVNASMLQAEDLLTDALDMQGLLD